MNNLIDNGKISTIIISILTAFAAAIIADPQILGQIGVPAQYIAVLAMVIGIIYNALYPRNPTPAVEAQVEEGA